MNLDLNKPVVFFDGYCHLCNGFIDWLVSVDKHRLFLYAPLQGTTAEQYLSVDQRQKLESVIVLVNRTESTKDKVLTESTAILHLMSLLPLPWKIFSVLRIIPAFLRDIVYRLIAKNRYVLFGKRDSCRLPTPEERQYILP